MEARFERRKKMQAEAAVVRGLEGVVSHATNLSEVDGENGRLVIRGYDITELVGHASFEEVAYLLWHGDLPNASQLRELQNEMAAARRLPDEVMDVIKGPARGSSGMHALRMGAAMLSVDDPTADDTSPEPNLRRATRITARIPALVAHHYQLRQSGKIFEPPENLGVAAGYLYMIEGKEPESARVDALNAYMVGVIDHGMNASTFTARVIASTASDMISAVTGAVGALKGPLHGGVPGPVLEMVNDIGSADRTEAWVRAALDRGDRIMGFGHRVYKVRDPRAEVLSGAAERLIASGHGDRALLDLIREVERVTVKVLGEVKPGRDLYANVELYAALVLHALDIPSEIFTPTFAAARTGGWTAHVLEQFADNRLIRPQSVYVGPHDKKFAPASQR
jgi:citrate synthase